MCCRPRGSVHIIGMHLVEGPLSSEGAAAPARELKVTTGAKNPISRRVLLAAAALAVLVAGCGQSATQSSTPVSATASPQTGPPIAVTLSSQPSGTATLSWNLRTKSVSVRLQMAGFTPGSSHAMHIHQGSCTAQGAVLVPFPDVTADEHGVIDTTVTALQPSPAGLAAGTLLNIHLGSGAELGDPGSLGYTPISCAVIAPGASTTVTMAPLPQPGQNPQGSATLTYNPAKKTLSVTVTTTDLVAGSVHAVDIHDGSCESQGPVTYPLSDLTASPTGAAQASTVIQDVDEAPPAPGWYVNVHLGSNSQIEQNGQPALAFEPMLCGNIGR